MDSVTGLALGRVAIGSVALASPALAARLFRLDAGSNPQLPYMTRMFGSREIALGAAALATSGRARTTVALAGVGVDAADVAAGVLAARDRSVTGSVGAGLTAPAVLAVVAGLSSLRRR